MDSPFKLSKDLWETCIVLLCPFDGIDPVIGCFPTWSYMFLVFSQMFWSLIAYCTILSVRIPVHNERHIWWSVFKCNKKWITSSISTKISFNQRQNLSGLNIILKILFKTSHVKLLCWDIMCLPPDVIIQTGQTTEVLRESIQLEIKYSIASKNLKVHSWSL